jgi:hypothetical protein
MLTTRVSFAFETCDATVIDVFCWANLPEGGSGCPGPGFSTYIILTSCSSKSNRLHITTSTSSSSTGRNIEHCSSCTNILTGTVFLPPVFLCLQSFDLCPVVD